MDLSIGVWTSSEGIRLAVVKVVVLIDLIYAFNNFVFKNWLLEIGIHVNSCPHASLENSPRLLLVLWTSVLPSTSLGRPVSVWLRLFENRLDCLLLLTRLASLVLVVLFALNHVEVVGCFAEPSFRFVDNSA